MGRRGSGLMMGKAPGLWALLPPSAHVDFISSMCQGSVRPSEGSGCPLALAGGWTALPWSWFPTLGLLARSPAHQLSPQTC